MAASSKIKNRFRQFLFPSLTRRFFIRVALVTLGAYVFFGHICTPFYIRGHSMDPTYRNDGVNFCWKVRYLFSKPKRFEVVVIRLAGPKIMLLKRVLALGGEQVEFRRGKLFVDGREIAEPYIRNPGEWNLPPRRVEKDFVYVVGDNRGMPMENHYFGQTPIKRIVGVPLW